MEFLWRPESLFQKSSMRRVTYSTVIFSVFMSALRVVFNRYPMWVDSILNCFQNFRLLSHPPISHVIVINSKLYHHHKKILIKPLIRQGTGLLLSWETLFCLILLRVYIHFWFLGWQRKFLNCLEIAYPHIQKSF